jgi:hypothetical protein
MASDNPKKLSVAGATIIAAIIIGGATIVTSLVGYLKASSTGQPTTLFQSINTGVQVFGDLITGGSKTALASTGESPARQRPARASADRPVRVQFPHGTVGTLTSNTSLMDGATWTLSPAPGDRTLDVIFLVQAEPTGNATGTATVRLLDSKGSPVCSTSINSATSARNGLVFSGGCRERSYLAPANVQIVFHAEAKAENAKLLDAELQQVVARPRQ